MSYQVIYEGKEIDLTPREFEVLYLLAQRPNWVIPKKNIYCSVWESNYYDDQIPYKTVEHVVWKIRKKMGHDIIETLDMELVTEYTELMKGLDEENERWMLLSEELEEVSK